MIQSLLFIKSPPLQQCMVFLNIPPFGGRYQQHIGQNGDRQKSKIPKRKGSQAEQVGRWGIDNRSKDQKPGRGDQPYNPGCPAP